jgi:membrane associated rhomboid family serine protease
VERLLARLERKYGRYAPGNLTYGLIAAQLGGLVLGLTAPEIIGRLEFDITRVLHGEVWRLVTWLAIPPSYSPFWALFSLYWLYIIGTALESEWGAFKYLFYFATGALGTVIAAAIGGVPTSNTVLVMTLFLAFATLWPDYEIRLFFVLPIRVKWLALLAGVGLIFSTLTQPGFEKLLPVVGVANYLLFFHQALRQRIRGFAREAGQAGARNRMRVAREAVVLPMVRRCAICGASSEDPEVDIRVCNCEKCGGVRRDLCLPHVRNH